ncbi:hypothetical protein Tco_0989612 [Tanacetum coccineum]|uniref:Uncharacterized protein n=1 Tax=Tanacetum coccineum TaxID=301880 RepID=A0ABQ5EUV7_9ASTR
MHCTSTRVDRAASGLCIQLSFPSVARCLVLQSEVSISYAERVLHVICFSRYAIQISDSSVEMRTAQLVPKFQSIRRFNNYDVLQNISCSPECKIVGQILLDHPLSYALTTTANVPAVYLQQFWKTVSKVSNTKDTIKFKLNSQEIVYTVDMFRSTLSLLVETTENPFIEPATMKFIQPFMQIVGYQGVVDKKDVITYPRFTKLIIADLTKKFDSIPQRLKEEYHSIKDDIPLVSVYTTGNVTLKGMLILDEFITDDICATEEYKEYVKVFVGVEVPTIQLQPVVSTQGTHKTTCSAHRSPTLTTSSPQKKRKPVAGETSSPRKSLKVTIRQKKPCKTSLPPPGDDRERDEMAEVTLLSLTLHKTTLSVKAKENLAKVQEKLDEEIEKMVEGEDNEESYASEFAYSVYQDDDDDSGRIEPRSHKEHPEHVDDDDDETENEKKDD